MDGLGFSGLPLGGLGCGSVEIRADGYLHEWQIANNAPWGAGPALPAPPDSCFFGLQVCGLPGGDRTLILGTVPEHRFHSTTAPWNDPYALAFIDYASEITAETRFPFTRLRYHYPDLPLTIELEAFSPFVPHDSRASGCPAAYFRFRISNQGDTPLRCCLFGALRNLAGYSHDLPGTAVVQERLAGTCLRLGRDGLDQRSNDNGELILGLLGGGETSWLAHARCRDLWEPLQERGQLDNRDLGDFSGAVGNAGDEQLVQARKGLPLSALGGQFALAAGAEQEQTFILAWYFPHMSDRHYRGKDCAPSEIGHQYANWFAEVGAVFDEAAASMVSREAASRAFCEAYYQSGQPAWLLDAINAQFTTLFKASWWDHQGRFGIWEGLGCCGLQTTDITHYGSFGIVQLFPDLQQSQMDLTRSYITDVGRVPHMMPGSFGCCDVDPHGRKDLAPQYVLAIWRDVLWTGDRAYLESHWPSILQAVAYARGFDTNGDGLPDNHGPDQTYDQFPLEGTSALVGFLYAGMLGAAADLAALLDDDAQATALRAEQATALATLDEQLWTGSYYRLSYDCGSDRADQGVMTDQINADWFMRQASGHGLLPLDRARSAMSCVLRHNQRPQGYLANCSWPDGGGVAIGRHTANQAEWPWSGVEYAVAAHCSLLDMDAEGEQVAGQVWQRYERAGLRFNHVECGKHYYRAMSAWAIYLARYRFTWNALTARLSFRLPAGAMVVAGHAGWGQAVVVADGIELRWQAGSISLSELAIDGAQGPLRQARVNGTALAATANGGALRLAASLTLEPGDLLTLT